MADERIDIEIKDSVSPAIATKLAKIGAEARSAHSAVEQLKLSISTLNASPVAQISAALNNNTRAIDRNALSSQRLATEVQRTQVAMARVETELNKAASAETAAATAAAKLATEQQKTATAAAQAAAAQDRAALAALRLESAQNKAARATGDMEARAERLKSELYPLWAAQQKHNREVQEALSLYKAGAISVKTYTDAVNQSSERLESAQIAHNRFNNNLSQTSKRGQLARHDLVNLGYQINDIGVSLASGQKPLTVFIQQGSQIAGIAAASGVGLAGMARAILGVVARFTPFLAVLGGSIALLESFKNSVEEQASLKDFVETLGLTRREMKKLEDVTITTGDVFRGFFATIEERTGIGQFFSDLASYAKNAFMLAFDFAKRFYIGLYASQVAAINTIKQTWDKLPAIFGEAFTNAANLAVKPLEFIINKSIAGINKLVGIANSLAEKAGLEKVFDPISEVALPRLTDKFDGTLQNISQVFKTEFELASKNGLNAFDSFFADLEKNSIESAKKRLKDQADLIKKDRIENEGYNRAEELAKVNKELDQQISLMQVLPNLRAGEVQFYQITNQLADKKISLSESENEALRQKIQLVEQMNRVASEEASLYSTTVGMRQQFIDQMTAIQNLRANSQSGFTQADQASATNSLMQGMGIDTTNFQSNFQAQLAANQEFTEQIEELNNRKLISDREYAAASMQIELQRQNLYLNSASSFFGNLTALQKSGNKKMAQVGKAAAIAQAMISTYQSATSAYAAMAGIPYVGPALGAAAAAAAIVAGLANVEQIRNQSSGFKTGGYTGNGGVNEVAGFVHGQEFVMNAQATSRIGKVDLQALQAGAASVQRNDDRGVAANAQRSQAAVPVQAAAPNVNIPFTAIVVQTKEAALAALRSSEGKSVIIETLEENSSTVARIAGAK